MAEPAADPDRFDAAVEAFRKRVPVDRESWDLLTTQQRERAFTVSRVTEGRVLQSTFDAIDRAVAEGSTLQDFKDSVAADLIESWGGEIPGRLETIFRTNVMGAYGEGRHAIMSSPTVKQARPYWRFDDAETDRECEICGECGGTTLPADDPWWGVTQPTDAHELRVQEDRPVPRRSRRGRHRRQGSRHRCRRRLRGRTIAGRDQLGLRP